MAHAEYRALLSVEKNKLLSAITQYEDYPQFVEGCEFVKVERQASGVTRVAYQVNVMSKEVNYTLDHRENLDAGTIEWNLVESNFFKQNIGKWDVKSAGPGKTDVLYSLEVEFKVPVPGFILNRLVKGSLPGMVKSFEKQANGS